MSVRVVVLDEEDWGEELELLERDGYASGFGVGHAAGYGYGAGHSYFYGFGYGNGDGSESSAETI